MRYDLRYRIVQYKKEWRVVLMLYPNSIHAHCVFQGTLFECMMTMEGYPFLGGY